MREHVLVVGSGRDLPARVRRARPGTETSVICRLEFVAKLRELTEHTRVIAVRDDAPDEEWCHLPQPSTSCIRSVGSPPSARPTRTAAP